jgi:hypothetical protein
MGKSDLVFLVTEAQSGKDTGQASVSHHLVCNCSDQHRGPLNWVLVGMVA